MKKISKPAIIIISAALIFASCGGSFKIEEIPEGSWDYSILMNDVNVGKGFITIIKKDDSHIHKSEFTIEFSGVHNKTSHTIVETPDFSPISIETENITERGDMKIEYSFRADFDGNNVVLKADGKEIDFTIDVPFVLEGGYVLSRLIEEGAGPGAEFQYNVYDPAIEPDGPIPVTTIVKGYQRVTVNNESRRLLHLQHILDDVKIMNSYLDEKGVIQKMEMSMLNSTIVLEIKND